MFGDWDLSRLATLLAAGVQTTWKFQAASVLKWLKCLREVMWSVAMAAEMPNLQALWKQGAAGHRSPLEQMCVWALRDAFRQVGVKDDSTTLALCLMVFSIPQKSHMRQ